MRQRRTARREANEPTTSSSSAQTEQQPPPIPVRRRNLSNRVAADRERIAARLNPANSDSSEVSTNSSGSRLEAFLNRSHAQRLIAQNRRRRLLDAPDIPTDIHRVARSQTYSDLLDHPLGPTTRAVRRGAPRMLELVDLTADDTEASILSRITRISSSSSSSSSSSGSSLSVPSPLSMDTSDDLSDLDILRSRNDTTSSSSSSSSDHEEWDTSHKQFIFFSFPVIFDYSVLFLYFTKSEKSHEKHSKLFLIRNHFPLMLKLFLHNY